jgi:hypothetical protein
MLNVSKHVSGVDQAIPSNLCIRAQMVAQIDALDANRYRRISLVVAKEHWRLGRAADLDVGADELADLCHNVW